jgi:hypothetical protein
MKNFASAARKSQNDVDSRASDRLVAPADLVDLPVSDPEAPDAPEPGRLRNPIHRQFRVADELLREVQPPRLRHRAG